MTIAEALAKLHEGFTQVASDFALPEAERVLIFLLDCPRSYIYVNGNDVLPEKTVQQIEKIMRRRRLDEPLAYILGSAYFYNREFKVSPAVLIPRPDTEILVEEVLKREAGERQRFLDLGTGSGCIAAILTEERPLWKCIAIDRSLFALLVAKSNRRSDFALVCADRLSAIKPSHLFDFIVSNPPYIPSSIVEELPKSVRGFEPRVALDGGVKGLDFLRYLAENAALLLKPEGRIYCEIGFDQGDAAPALFTQCRWRDIMVQKDLGGRPRVIRSIRPEGQSI
jgi:release factor glutamine methyltransferase